jgi:nucleoside-diphosphate-sugar epimerase
MKYFVTGASGFIGSWVVRRLLDQAGMEGTTEVCCLVRPGSNRRWLRDPRLEIRMGSLEDSAALVRGVEDADCVIHAAGAIKALRADDYFRTNVAGTVNLLEAIATANPRLRRLVLISSQAAAGPAPSAEPLTETAPPAPVSDYGRSKLLAEQAVRRHYAGIPWTILRPAVVYGPRDTALLPLFRLAACGIAPSLLRGTRQFSAVWIDDLVSAILAAAEAPRCAGETFFVSAEEPVNTAEFCAGIARLAGRKPLPLPLPHGIIRIAAAATGLAARIGGRPQMLSRDKIRELSQLYWLASSTRLTECLEWAPQTDLDSGLRATLEWYRAEGWL